MNVLLDSCYIQAYGLVRNKNTGTDSNAMSRALRFVVREVSARLRLIPIFTRWLKSKITEWAQHSCTKRVDCAVESMTYVLRTCRVKTKVGLANSFGTTVQKLEIVFWQNAQIGGSNRITARFRISGHNEKQLTAKATKRFGDIKITLCMMMIEIEDVVIFSPS